MTENRKAVIWTKEILLEMAKRLPMAATPRQEFPYLSCARRKSAA